MSKIFLRKQFSYYLGENRAINDTIVQFGPDPSPTPVPITPTPTPTITSTPSPTPSITTTPSITPTNTSSVTPTITPTKTSTPTPTPTTSTAAWTPASLTGLYDWWSSSFGLNLTGSFINSWQGFYGNLLIPKTPTERAIYYATDPDFNNYPSVRLNPNLAQNAGYNATASTNSTSKTLIIVSKIIDDWNSPYDYHPVIGLGVETGADPNMIFFGMTNSYPNMYELYSNQGGGEDRFAPGLYTTGNYLVSMLQYDYSSGSMTLYGSNNSSITTFSSTRTIASGINFTTGKINLGNYYNTGCCDNPSILQIVDIIAVDNILTAGELTSLQNYINTKYGI